MRKISYHNKIAKKLMFCFNAVFVHISHITFRFVVNITFILNEVTIKNQNFKVSDCSVH